MSQLKMKVLQELMDHLKDQQGSSLKSLMDESKPPMMEEDPNGVKIESIELMGKPEEIMDVAQNDKGGKQTLGEAIGYPGFKKEKPHAMMEQNPLDELTDEELEERARMFT